MIEQPTAGKPTASGQRTDSWGTFATRWAEVVASGGREFIAAQQVRAEMTHLLRLRYLSGVTTTMRVRLGTRYLYVISVENVFERDRELRLTCVEKV